MQPATGSGYRSSSRCTRVLPPVAALAIAACNQPATPPTQPSPPPPPRPRPDRPPPPPPSGTTASRARYASRLRTPTAPSSSSPRCNRAIPPLRSASAPSTATAATSISTASPTIATASCCSTAPRRRRRRRNSGGLGAVEHAAGAGLDPRPCRRWRLDLRPGRPGNEQPVARRRAPLRTRRRPDRARHRRLAARRRHLRYRQGEHPPRRRPGARTPRRTRHRRRRRHRLDRGPYRRQGHHAYNKRLSAQRAKAVKAVLVARGVDAARLTTIGLGKLRPVAPNATATDDEAGHQRNRRLEVILPGAAPAATGAGTG